MLRLSVIDLRGKTREAGLRISETISTSAFFKYVLFLNNSNIFLFMNFY